MTIVQLRNDTEGRAYYRRKLPAGKTSMEAMRALKRRFSDLVYKQMVKDVAPAVAVARKLLTYVYYGLRDGYIRALAKVKAA